MIDAVTYSLVLLYNLYESILLCKRLDSVEIILELKGAREIAEGIKFQFYFAKRLIAA